MCSGQIDLEQLILIINQRKSGQSVHEAFYQGFVRTFIFCLTFSVADLRFTQVFLRAKTLFSFAGLRLTLKFREAKLYFTQKLRATFA